MLACDGSNYGGELTPDIVRCWCGNGADIYICGVDLGHIPLARQQLGMAAQGGLATDIYRFCYWGTNPQTSLQRVADAIQGLSIGKIWLDFEDEDAPGDNPDQVCTWIQDCLDEADSIWGRDRVGIYTAAWWWNPYTGGTTRFANRELWAMQQDGLANLDFVSFGGWTSCVMKQYQGTTNFCGYSVDMNYYEGDNSNMDEETKKQVARIALLQRWAGMIQSGDEALSDKAYQEMRYIRQLAGKPV